MGFMPDAERDNTDFQTVKGGRADTSGATRSTLPTRTLPI